MRKSPAETADTRRRIVRTAAAEFRRNGIEGTGLATLMGKAGLTHGGFYRHFDSKEHLLAEASALGHDALVDKLESQKAATPKRSPLRTMVEQYLTAEHRDHPEGGCMYAALGSELARSDEKTRTAATAGLSKLLDAVMTKATGVPAGISRAEALVSIMTMIGAVTMARVVNDPGLSTEILEQTRKRLGHV